MTEHANYTTISPVESTVSDRSPVELQQEVNTLKEQLAAKASWISPEILQQRIASVRSVCFEHDDLAEKVMEYDEGCEDGKYRFLEYLGIEDCLPSQQATVSFVVSLPYMTDDAWESFENDVNYELNRINLDRGEVDDYSIEVSRY